MNKRLLLHPFLFAVFPVIFIYSHNMNEVSLVEQFPVLLLILLTVFVLQYLLPLIFHNKTKVALFITLCVFIFFSYGHIYELMRGIYFGSFRLANPKFILPLLLLIFTAGTFFIIRTGKNLNGLTSTLNFISALLIIFSAANILLFEINKKENNDVSEILRAQAIKDVNGPGKPDIYYIILDAYTSSACLKDIYGYDNSDFEYFLRQKGFYIASNSKSNYAETRLSLASSLNMKHINFLGDSLDVPLLYHLINNNRVMKFLGNKDYKIVNISSTNIGKIEEIDYAHENLEIGNYTSVKFQAALLESSILSVFKKYINFAGYYRQEIISTFSAIADYEKKVRKPHFIFAHILLPHPPYVFGPNGEPTFRSLKLDEWGDLNSQRKLYTGQVAFTNKIMKRVINKILSRPGPRPVIIIQGDHGPQLATEQRLDARMRIFNAIYIPDKRYHYLYDSVTPVNTFRLIFNRYFNTNLQLHEDRSYFTNYSLPYNFEDVTEQIAGSSRIKTNL